MRLLAFALVLSVTPAMAQRPGAGVGLHAGVAVSDGSSRGFAVGLDYMRFATRRLAWRVDTRLSFASTFSDDASAPAPAIGVPTLTNAVATRDVCCFPDDVKLGSLAIGALLYERPDRHGFYGIVMAGPQVRWDHDDGRRVALAAHVGLGLSLGILSLEALYVPVIGSRHAPAYTIPLTAGLRL